MSFFSRDYETRFAVYRAVESAGCQTYNPGGSGALCVAVAKGRFGDLLTALQPFALINTDLYYFPLGTDTPDDRFRHDRSNVPASNWLVAVFK
jgi:hypothetical protein